MNEEIRYEETLPDGSTMTITVSGSTPEARLEAMEIAENWKGAIAGLASGIAKGDVTG